MAGAHVKTEPERNVSPFLADKSYPTSSNYQVASNLLWKQEQDTLHQRVEVKEQSLKIAISEILELKSKFLKYTDGIPSLEKIVENIDTVLMRQHKCRVTAGAIAPTGMGKSTAWNAILGFPELLPTDNAQACTSAIIEVLYNADKDPASAFRAKITFLKVREWELELEQLYKDMEALARKDAGQDDDWDFEIEGQVDSVMEKVRVVYPFIDNRQDLKRYSVAQLISHDNVKSLGKELTFSEADQKKFSAKIRRYIVSSTTAREKAALWPLVKVAEIYVKSQVLENGLVLVDIPGSMDTNAARNTLAQTYQRQLSVTCILTASKRAASDQTAQICLNETFQRHMQLDGRWKSENVIFIVVRTDESISVEDHISKNLAVEEKLTAVCQKEERLNIRKSSIQNEINTFRTQAIEATKKIADLDKRVRELWSWFNNFPEIKNLAPSVKRKSGSECLKQVLKSTKLSAESLANTRELDLLRADRLGARKQWQSANLRLNGKYEELKQVDQKLAQVNCSKLRACIDDRSEVQTAKIREYFDRISKETGAPADTEPLQVVCISAAKYLDFLREKPPSPGFPNKDCTRIPQLRAALTATTLEARHRVAKATLEELEALLSSIHSWAESLASSFQMKHEQKGKLEENFEEAVDDLIKGLSRLSMSAIDSVNIAIKLGLSTKLRSIERKAATTAPNVSDEWGSRQVAWNTYRAILQRLGEFRSVVRPDPYSWNEDLSRNYFTDHLKKLWTKLFEATLPPIRTQLSESVNNLLANFSQAVIKISDDICPEIHGSVQSVAQSITQQGLVLQEAYELGWDGKLASGRGDTHRSLRRQLQEFMTEAYEDAAIETGTGFKKRAQAILREHLKDESRAMYTESSSALMVGLNRMVVALKDDLDCTPNDFIEQAREMFHMVLMNHKPASCNPNNQKALTEIKRRLLREVTTTIDHLNKCLEDNVHIPLEELDETPLSYDINEEIIVPKIFDSDDWFGSGSEAGEDDIAMAVDGDFRPDQSMDLNV